ncbi:TldD/PmbA family protein [Methylocystis bryophila]|uniref:Peptidase n=1 Tax=Methylocystis bryophila TaxID=655015 RepID=A0A1W6MVW6_9HYPH|nr:TldD/PmbA family protein [Methylocystis bryophila]ARN81707.1 peptidase [Methylocystis bryophila]BDV37757.1 modulator of DNA gyrase [Methylocystis bryophila]
MNAPFRSRRRASAPHPAPAEPDESARLALAELALALAREGGADYADIRLGATFWESLRVREERLEDAGNGESWGFGLRLLRRGSWGFCGSTTLTPDAIRRAVETALANARAVEPIQGAKIELEALPVVEDRWVMALGVDPFAVAIGEKAEFLLNVNAAARDAGADFCTSHFQAAREERLFANSRGSRIWQSRTRVWPEFQITVVDKKSGRFATRDSLIPPRGAGWDHVEACGFLEEARRGAEEARQKLHAKPVAPGRRDLVIEPSNLFLTIHETVGHSTELDRALGWEANFAGTTFVKPQRLGELRFGSELMTIFADRRQEGALATIGYDDDGAPASFADFNIVEKGVFKNFQMAIGQAHYLGLPMTNGCAYADDLCAVPLQRMPNISLKPSERPCSRDALIAGVEDGLYVVGAGSWSIDQQRDNFQFGGQLFYEIKNGKLGEMVQGAAYQGRTLDFWSGLDGLGDASTYALWGVFTCGKAEPIQLAPVSHGAPCARFRGVEVLNTDVGG